MKKRIDEWLWPLTFEDIAFAMVISLVGGVVAAGFAYTLALLVL